MKGDKPAKKDGDIITIHVGPAGIGRQGFKAWWTIGDIDRQDGDDTGTYDSPKEAVMALMDKFERELLLRAWHALTEE